MEPLHVTNTITDYLVPYFKNSDLNLFAVNKFLLIMFKNNIFKFNNKFYVKRKGLIMGSSCGPMVANLYLFILEKKWITFHKPLIYKRFIDYIFLVTINGFIVTMNLRRNLLI